MARAELDFLRPHKMDDWDKAVAAIDVLEELGFEVQLQRVISDGVKPAPPRYPLEVRTSITPKGKKVKARGALIEMIATHFLNEWRREMSTVDLVKEVYPKFGRSSYGGTTIVRKAVNRLLDADFLLVSRKAAGPNPAVFRINVDYDPDHSLLAFLKERYPNGLQDFDLTVSS